MILHASFAAARPRETAQLLATLLGGHAFPMHGPGTGAWHAAGADPIGNYVEVLPSGTEFHPAEDGGIEMREGLASRRCMGTHILIESPLDERGILDAAKDAEVKAKKISNGFFELIACWIDGCQLIEVLSPRMAQAYRSIFEPERVKEYVARLPLA